MKRLLLGLALGVLIAAPLGYAGAKVVSNPMSADLDGGPRDPYQGVQANQPIGSVYVEQAGATPGNLLSGTAIVWVKTGPLATDWRQLAYAP